MYIPKPIDTNNVVLPEQLMSLQEKIAENVHEIWAQGRIADGWTYGEKRDDELKHHPCLVPYSELSDAEKEYDRNTAMETLKLITALGYNIEDPSHNKEMRDNEEARKSDFIFNENGNLLHYVGDEKDVVMPNCSTGIAYCAFHNRTSLTSVIISDSVKRISEEAFYGCESLKSIIFEGNPKLDREVFKGCCPKEIIVCNEEMKQYLIENVDLPEDCEIKVAEKELDKDDEITNIEIGTNILTNKEVGEVCKGIMDSPKEFVYDEVSDKETSIDD